MITVNMSPSEINLLIRLKPGNTEESGIPLAVHKIIY